MGMSGNRKNGRGLPHDLVCDPSGNGTHCEAVRFFSVFKAGGRGKSSSRLPLWGVGATAGVWGESKADRISVWINSGVMGVWGGGPTIGVEATAEGTLGEGERTWTFSVGEESRDNDWSR